MASKQVPSAAPWVPQSPTLPLLKTASKNCEGCELFRNATQTVFGDGPPEASVVMVGEQPGDQEDLAGKPFVGPAGKLLDRGTFFPHQWAKALMATVHPSALLRMPEPERREEEYRLLVRDLALIPKQLRRAV